MTPAELTNTNCANTDPESWFDEEQYPYVKAVCEGCPVIEKCAAYAIKNRILYGVWGGMTPWERRTGKVQYANIWNLRQKGWSNEQIARSMGIKPDTIQRYFNKAKREMAHD